MTGLLRRWLTAVTLLGAQYLPHKLFVPFSRACTRTDQWLKNSESRKRWQG